MRQSVVLVHGLRTSASMWRGQVAALEAADRGGCDRFDGQFLPAVVRAIAKEKAG